MLSQHAEPVLLLYNNTQHMRQETFAKEGLDYSMEGQTGSTLNSHRLIALAGQQGLDRQDKLVELLFKAYFTQVCSYYAKPIVCCTQCVLHTYCMLDGHNARCSNDGAQSHCLN